MAEIKITQIGGFSTCTGKLCTDNSQTVTKVYGGRVSGLDCSSTDLANPCDTCEVAGDGEACNSRSIYPNLRLKITFESSTVYGTPLITIDDTNPTRLDDISMSPTGNGSGSDAPENNKTTKVNSPVTVYIPWSTLCNDVLGVSSCSSSAASTKRIRVGFDSSTDSDDTIDDYSTQIELGLSVINSGASPATFCESTVSYSGLSACNFIAYPGDGKVFIEDVKAPSSFPGITSSDVDFSSIRIYYAERTLPNTQTASSKDFKVSSNSSTGFQTLGLSDNTIEGLNNGSEYWFRMASIDEAGNVGYFTSISNTVASLNTECFDTTSTDAWQQNCHIASPSKVVGLLEEEFDCFITTATYGTPFRPKVKTFRKFRNRILKRSSLGRLLIQTYYTVSPPIAKWIRNHPKSKAVFRVVLWPLWAAAGLALHFTSHLAFIFILLGIGFFVWRARGRKV
ncbi:MAG: hypothetical protein KDD33_00300 [Bdellovibrionales bacterium]|nr:hypothetical protein [Bdellovibrionales bacterium]